MTGHTQKKLGFAILHKDYLTMENEVWEESPPTTNAVERRNAGYKQNNLSHVRLTFINWTRQFVLSTLLQKVA